MKESSIHYNIVTSSDQTLVPQIAVSITAMAKNLAHARIAFYLLHSQIEPKSIELLSALCGGYGNIEFHEIQVEAPERFDPLVRAGRWLRETYFPLCAHELLPDTLDRALYLDAGDTLVLGDIAPYYNCDFEDNFLVVTGEKFKEEQGQLFTFSPDDIRVPLFCSRICSGLFNSGSYVINLKKMREEGLDLSFYYALTEKLRASGQRADDEGSVYFGDQGLLSAAFVGRVKYYGYPQIRKLWYWPYNFLLGYYDYFDKKPDYQPAILHFAGVPIKPWRVNYPIFPNRFKMAGGNPRELSELKPMQLEYYFLWLEYLLLTDQALTVLGR